MFVCSQAGVSDDSARPSRSGGKAQPVKVGVKPLHKLEDLTHSAASSTSSSYLTSSRSAFSKCRLQTTWAVRYDTRLLIELTPKGVVFPFLFQAADLQECAYHEQCSLVSSAISHEGVLQQEAFMPSVLPGEPCGPFSGCLCPWNCTGNAGVVHTPAAVHI